MKSPSTVKAIFMMAGIIVLVTVIGFVIIACENEVPEKNPFIGKWTGLDPYGEPMEVTVTDTSIIIRYSYGDSYSGTYTYSGNTVTFSLTIMGQGMSGTGTISGNTLILSGVYQGEQVTMTLTKS